MSNEKVNGDPRIYEIVEAMGRTIMSAIMIRTMMARRDLEEFHQNLEKAADELYELTKGERPLEPALKVIDKRLKKALVAFEDVTVKMLEESDVGIEIMMHVLDLNSQMLNTINEVFSLRAKLAFVKNKARVNDDDWRYPDDEDLQTLD